MTAEPRTPEQTIREALGRLLYHDSWEQPYVDRGHEAINSLANEIADLRAELAKLEKRRVGARSDAEGFKSLYHEARAELAERTAALELTNDSYLAAEKENTRLRAELAAARICYGSFLDWCIGYVSVPDGAVTTVGWFDLLYTRLRDERAALAAAPASPAEAPTSDQTCDRCGETNETVDYRFDAPAGTPVALCVPCAPLWRPPAEAPQAEPASEQIGYVDLGTLGSVPMYVREAASTAEPDICPRCHGRVAFHADLDALGCRTCGWGIAPTAEPGTGDLPKEEAND